MTIRGLSITPDTTVTFGAGAGSEIVVLDSTTIFVKSPPGSPGSVAVAVVNGNGVGSLGNAYTYVAPRGTVLSYGQTVTGQIAALGQAGQFTFEAAEGDIVTLRMSRASGGIDPMIQLLDFEDHPVAQKSALTYAQLDLLLPAPGVYFVGARDDADDETGAFGLSMQRLNGPSGAIMMNFGSVSNRSLTLPAELQAFQFSAATGDVVRVRMSRSSGIDPRIELFDAQGTRLTNRTEFADAVVDLPLTSGGTYYFLLSDADGDEAGAYGVSLERLNNPANPRPIAYGQTLQASVDAVGEMDAYSFQAQAGDVVRVRMSRSSGIDPQIELFDNQGRRLTNATAFADTVLDVSLGSGGTYYFLLSDESGDETGAYGVSLERLNNPTNPRLIAYGQTLQASLGAVGEMDAYSFQAQAGDVVRVRMSRSSGIDPQIELFDAQGLRLTNTMAFADAVLDVSLAGGGTYYFLLSDDGGDETGQYGVSLERLNNPASPRPIAYGQTLQASVDAVGEMDAYSFQAQAGDTVRMRMSRSSGIDPQIELFDAQGRRLTNTVAFADAVLDVSLASGGTYYFLLSDENGDETGAYGVSLERLNIPANARLMTYGQTIQAAIDAVAEMDAYSFQAQAGDKVRVQMSRSSGIDPQIELFDTQGRRLANTVAFADAVLDVSLASAGTYYVLLSDENGDETGAYSVSLILNP